MADLDRLARKRQIGRDCHRRWRQSATPEELAEHRKYSREYTAARRAARPELAERERTYIRDARQRFIGRFLVRGAKARAKKLGRECDLTCEWADLRWTGKCELTGLDFVPGVGERSMSPYSPSIDRIDSSRGYLQSNCRFILAGINYLKANGTDKQMFEIAAALVARRLSSQT